MQARSLSNEEVTSKIGDLCFKCESLAHAQTGHYGFFRHSSGLINLHTLQCENIFLNLNLSLHDILNYESGNTFLRTGDNTSPKISAWICVGIELLLLSETESTGQNYLVLLYSSFKATFKTSCAKERVAIIMLKSTCQYISWQTTKLLNKLFLHKTMPAPHDDSLVYKRTVLLLFPVTTGSWSSCLHSSGGLANWRAKAPAAFPKRWVTVDWVSFSYFLLLYLISLRCRLDDGCSSWTLDVPAPPAAVAGAADRGGSGRPGGGCRGAAARCQRSSPGWGGGGQWRRQELRAPGRGPRGPGGSAGPGEWVRLLTPSLHVETVPLLGRIKENTGVRGDSRVCLGPRAIITKGPYKLLSSPSKS